MENKKSLLIVLVLILILVIMGVSFVSNRDEDAFRVQENAKEEAQSEDEERKANSKNYQLVTYNQAADAVSYIQSITVKLEKDGEINFVIGSVDENWVVTERKRFSANCKQGENRINPKEKYLVKKGEYVFMDMTGQEVELEEPEDSEEKVLVQEESNKTNGKIPLTKSNLILPFQYTLEKTEEYHALVIGDTILTNPRAQQTYYDFAKAELQNIFSDLKMNQLDGTNWETSSDSQSKINWINATLKENLLSDMDLVIFQLGEDYMGNDLEADLTNLMEYAKEKAPDAEFVWVVGWNQNETLLNVLPRVCEKFGSGIVRINDLRTDEYQIVEQDEYEYTLADLEYLSELPEPEMHYYPNDKAMEMIANRILEYLNFKESEN